MSDDAQDADQQAAQPTVHHQARFSDGGEVSVEGEVTATSLGDFGADVGDHDPETRIDEPKASEFGVDDRTCVQRSEGGEQARLFADVEADQRTLTGEQASQQFQFEEAADD